MHRYLAFSFLMVCPAVTQAQVYDLKNDWSDSQNPNGIWQYRAGTTDLVHAPDWTGSMIGYPQPVWTVTNTPSPGALCPAIFQATGTRAGDDYALGDILIHSNSPTCGNDIDIGNVAWTAPANAVITVSGNLWQTGFRAGPNSRNNTATLRLNNSVTLQTISNLAGYSSVSPAVLSVTNLTVNQGDVLSLNVVRDPNTPGYLVDISLHIVARPPAVTVLLPQIAFGGGWYTAAYFTNTSGNPVIFPVSFVSDSGGPLNVPSAVGSSVNVNIAGFGTAIIEAPNAGQVTEEGYAWASLPAGVVGYGVFRSSVPGRNDQEAVVPLTTGSTTSTLTWDDTSYVTAVAIVNPSTFPVNVSVTTWDSSGNNVGTSSFSMVAKSKTTAALRNLAGLEGVAGKRGSARFTALYTHTVAPASLAVLGLRFNGAAFTSIPVANQ